MDLSLSSPLITPYGGSLVDRRARPGEQEELVRRASALPSFSLTTRGLCDLELLVTGVTPEQNAQRILELLLARGLVREEAAGA